MASMLDLRPNIGAVEVARRPDDGVANDPDDGAADVPVDVVTLDVSYYPYVGPYILLIVLY